MSASGVRSRVGGAGIVAWLLATVIVLACAPSTARAKNVALVIGNDAYREVQTLRTAASDARAVGDAMERLGFVVRRAIDVDQRAMDRALSAFDADLQPGDQAFFFYAGHGIEISGANYLLPTDVPAAQPNQREIVRGASVPVERIVDGIRARGARVAVLVLDACRDNPFAQPGTRGAAATGGLARVEAEGVFVLMSAGAKQEALDRLSSNDEAPNSVFTRTFLGEIDQPGRTMVEIAKATQVKVRDLAASVGYEQTPAYYDQVIGDVVFAPSGGAAAAPPSPAVVARVTPGEAAPTRQQLASIDPTAPAPPTPTGAALALGGRAPIASFTRSNQGWSVYVSLPEPALELSWRVGGAGEFKSTGLSDTLDQRTGERAPNFGFPLSARTGPTVLELRYRTQDGGTVGPFAIRFDPDQALFAQQKKTLQQLATNWVEFHDFNGPIAYFSTVLSYRCAIAELRYGMDGAAPLTRFDLPGCTPSDPFAIPEKATIFLRVPKATRSMNVQIVFRDGTISDVATFQR